MYSRILIIGNGFDLNLGLDTSYSSFFNSEQFKNLLSNNNYISKSLVSSIKGSEKNWIDIEQWMSEKANRFDKESLIEDYPKFIESFKEFINSIDYNKIDVESCAFKLVENQLTRTDILNVFSFNYTNSIEEILLRSTSKGLAKYPKIKVHHLHGSIKEGDIIFGVDDEAKIPKELELIRKSSSKIHGRFDFRSKLVDKKIREILFFGHSLGESDYWYFKNFFVNKSSSLPKRVDFHNDPKYKFYFHTDTSQINLSANMRELCNGKLSDFKESNIVEWINVYDRS